MHLLLAAFCPIYYIPIPLTVLLKVSPCTEILISGLALVKLKIRQGVFFQRGSQEGHVTILRSLTVDPFHVT